MPASRGSIDIAGNQKLAGPGRSRFVIARSFQSVRQTATYKIESVSDWLAGAASRTCSLRRFSRKIREDQPQEALWWTPLSDTHLQFYRTPLE